MGGIGTWVVFLEGFLGDGQTNTDGAYGFGSWSKLQPSSTPPKHIPNYLQYKHI